MLALQNISILGLVWLGDPDHRKNPDPAWKSTKTRAVPRVPPMGPHKLEGSSAGTTGAKKEGAPKQCTLDFKLKTPPCSDWMASEP